jgi:hypothetical protein
LKKIIAAAAILAAVVVPAAAGAAPGNGNGNGNNSTQTLTLKPTPNPVVAGRSVVLSGQLKGPNHSGKTVTLGGAPYPFTPFNNNVATTVTNSAGNYAFTRKPQLNTLYRTRVGGVSSPNVTVLVRRRVSLRLSDYTPRRGQIVRFSGRACPTGDGLIVSIQRKTSTGSYRTVRRTRLQAATRCSVYSRSLRIFRDGRFRAVVAADPSHLRGFSRSRVADAHR